MSLLVAPQWMQYQARDGTPRDPILPHACGSPAAADFCRIIHTHSSRHILALHKDPVISGHFINQHSTSSAHSNAVCILCTLMRVIRRTVHSISHPRYDLRR